MEPLKIIVGKEDIQLEHHKTELGNKGVYISYHYDAPDSYSDAILLFSIEVVQSMLKKFEDINQE